MLGLGGYGSTAQQVLCNGFVEEWKASRSVVYIYWLRQGGVQPTDSQSVVIGCVRMEEALQARKYFLLFASFGVGKPPTGFVH